MPRYELSLITRALSNKLTGVNKPLELLSYPPGNDRAFRKPSLLQEGLANILRRVATLVMEQGGVVRKMENLGEQELPYRMRAHNEWHTQGRYFLFDMDIGPTQLPSFQKELKLDTDLIRPRLVKLRPKKNVDDVLHCWTSYEKHNS